VKPRLLALGAAALALLIGCSSSPPVSVPTPPPGAVVVVADNTAFTAPTVTAPAGEAFTVFFENRESEQHNVRIWDAANTSLAATEIFGGPAARTLDVAALAAGTYRLTCDVHPEMTAQLVAQ
jgi:plastocyanin